MLVSEILCALLCLQTHTAAAAAGPSFLQQQQLARSKKRQRRSQQQRPDAGADHMEPGQQQQQQQQQRAGKRRCKQGQLAHPAFWSHWEQQLQQLLQQPAVTHADCEAVTHAVKAAKMRGGRPNSFKNLLAELQERAEQDKQQQQQQDSAEEEEHRSKQSEDDPDNEEGQQQQQTSAGLAAKESRTVRPQFWAARAAELRRRLQEPLATAADVAAAQAAIAAVAVSGGKPRMIVELLEMLQPQVQQLQRELHQQQLRGQRHLQRQAQQQDDSGAAPNPAIRSARPQFWADRVAALQQVLQQPLATADDVSAAEQVLHAARTSGRRPGPLL
jgi:hypothetical protein